jgi:hypothetical protein
MARTVIPPQAAGTRSDGSQAESGDKFPDKLVKYVPAETLAFFTPISASLGPGRTSLLIIAIIAGIIGTPGYLWLTARRLPKAKRPTIHFYLLAIVAFACWALGTSTSVDTLVGVDTVTAGGVLTIAVFLIPLIDNLITAAFGTDNSAAKP